MTSSDGEMGEEEGDMAAGRKEEKSMLIHPKYLSSKCRARI